ncbi:MAG: cadherin-like beta sandwich domain-containing protein [Clostridiales bacterium]|nr:cadherin-like beta sandwich domain-containing protein [Clostridiales bacterium]
MKKNKLYEVLSACMVVIILLAGLPIAKVSAAASPSLSVSGSLEENSVITVNIKISGTDGPYAGFSGGFNYDSTYLRLDSISQGNFTAESWSSSITNGTFQSYNGTIPSGTTIVSAKFTCLKAGTTTISLTEFEVDNNYTSASKSITISAYVPKSSNANLSSLRVSPGSFSPSFSSTRTSYSMSVGEDVSKITVNAAPEDSKASVSLNGVQNNIKPGTNRIKITVTAEDGSSKVYTITVTRASGPTGTPTPTPEPLPLMDYQGNEFMIIPIDEDTSIPDGFSATTATYKGVEIPVFEGPASEGSEEKILLVQLLTEQKIEYFVYDPIRQSVYPLLFVSQPESNMRILDAGDSTQVPFGYEVFEFEYNDEKVNAYRLISDPTNPQILLFLMDEDGSEAFYYYDTEKTMLMPYRGETVLVEPTATPTPSPEPTESIPAGVVTETSDPSGSTTNSSDDRSFLDRFTDYKNPFTIVFYLVCLIALVLLAAVIILLVNRRSDYDDYDPDYFPEDDSIPPIARYPDREVEASDDPDDVFEETDYVDYGKKPGDSFIPPIVRVNDPHSTSAPSSQKFHAEDHSAEPVKPVADSVPRMGVRNVRLDNIPGLAGSAAKSFESGQNSDAAANEEKNFAGEEKTEEHIPVRLKKELDEEKAKVESEEGVTKKQAEGTSDDHPEAKKAKTENVSPLDFPDVKNNAASQTGEKIEPGIEDPDLE